MSDPIPRLNAAREGRHVSELSQQGVSSRAYQPGPYSEQESMIAAWDREYLRALQ